jgi:hypothetical protein
MESSEEGLRIWKLRLDIRSFIDRKHGQWQTLSPAMKFYFTGISLLVLSMFLALIGLPKSAILFLSTAGLLSLMVGYLVETYLFILKLLSFGIGKLIAGLLLAIAIAIANGMAAATTNQVTGIDPALLAGTKAFVTPLMVIYFFVISSLLLFIASAVVIPIAAMLDTIGLGFVKNNTSEKMKQESKLLIHGLRFFGALCLLGFSESGWKQAQQPYESGLEKATGWFVYSFEMFPDKSCNVAQGAHVKKINEQLILVGKVVNSVYTFTTQPCNADTTGKPAPSVN